jgi:hypothetical protein
MPDELAEHVAQVRDSHSYAEMIEDFEHTDFGFVEIGPLLAYQLHVQTDRAEALCARVGSTPTPTDLAEICLPIQDEPYQPQVAQGPRSVTILSQSLNFRVTKEGMFEDNGSPYEVAGVIMGMSGPLMHVAVFEGRCYLRNGYHRAYALQRAGVSHLPCLIVQVSRFDRTGAVGGDETFTSEVLHSDNPPTCSHYTDEKALSVPLKRISKVINVSWTEETFLEP